MILTYIGKWDKNHFPLPLNPDVIFNYKFVFSFDNANDLE